MIGLVGSAVERPWANQLSAQAANRAQQLQLHVNGAKAEIEDLRQRSSMLNEALQRADETVGAVSERCDAAAARANQVDAKVTSLADRTMKSNVEVRAEVRAHPKKCDCGAHTTQGQV
jgi:septal ring factor EnvC (AmiA/AmiB activator)